jgi:hypothetical protein
MKNLYKKNEIQKNALFIIIVCIISCSDEKDCDYNVSGPEIPVGCDMQSELNLSTGLDTNGNIIAAGKGIVDPFWRVINNPPLLSCSDPLVSTINGDAYVINYSSIGSDGWVNQTGSTTLAPMDLGITDTFNCNNGSNNDGDTVPYVLERPFCVEEDTCIDFNFTFKGDDQVYLELIDNSDNSPLNISSTYVWSVTSVQTWNASNLCLLPGSYSLRAYLVNTNSTVLGFSMVGNLATTNGDASISNNVEGCCQNNVISILNILEENCDNVFDNGIDQLGDGWTYNLKDVTNSIIRTELTDANGNIFFSGLADGTYTIEIVNQTGWVQNNPSSGTITVSVSNNEATILEFFSCIN